MAARGSGRPAVRRGVPCKRGHDEWRIVKPGHHLCAVCDRARSRQHGRMRDELRPFDKMWKRAKERANDQQVPFLLTVADIENCWPDDSLCPALKIPLARGIGFIRDGSPTLDRLSNEGGYEPGNIAIISHRANRAKGGMRAGELEQVAAWMRTHGLD